MARDCCPSRSGTFAPAPSPSRLRCSPRATLRTSQRGMTPTSSAKWDHMCRDTIPLHVGLTGIFAATSDTGELLHSRHVGKRG